MAPDLVYPRALTGEIGENMHLICYIDGASLGNPGPAGAGVYIVDESGREILRCSRRLGVGTNNVAEYSALIEALKQAHRLGAKSLEIRSDSQLLVRQMTGEYRVKNPGLARLFLEAQRLLEKFDEVRFVHIPRNLNKVADRLAKTAAASQKS